MADLLCGHLPLINDKNKSSLQIKHSSHDKIYFIHTNEMSHSNIQVMNEAKKITAGWEARMPCGGSGREASGE